MQFVRIRRYEKDLKRLGLSEAEALLIEAGIASNPAAGDMISGLKGIRKIRVGLSGRGKRGGARVIYLLMLSDDLCVMLMAYAKNDKTDLTAADRKALLAVLKEMDDER